MSEYWDAKRSFSEVVSLPLTFTTSGDNTLVAAVTGRRIRVLACTISVASAVNIAVCPANLPAVIGAGSIVIPPGSETRIVGNRRVKVNCGWVGISATGSGNQLTALGLYG